MNIGLLGGTFNPIHNGHIQMAKEALDKLELDAVWLIPNKTPPHKRKADTISSEHKYNICKLACDKYDFLEVCDFELKRDDVNWTYMTVEGLGTIYPEHKFYFIMGADTLFKFDRWRNPDRICNCAEIIVLVRKGFDTETIKKETSRLEIKYNTRFHLVESKTVDVSSTEIRAGKKHDMLLPEIKEYIYKNKLYR